MLCLALTICFLAFIRRACKSLIIMNCDSSSFRPAPSFAAKYGRISVDSCSSWAVCFFLRPTNMSMAALIGIALNLVGVSIKFSISTRLINLEIIEKLIDTQTNFKAIPIKAAIDMLVGRRKKQTAQLEQESTEILPYFAANEGAGLKDEESQFIIINDLQARLIKAKKQIVSAKQSINIVTKWSFFLTYTLETIEEHIKALNRGVHIHIVTQIPENTGAFPKKLQKLVQHPHFEIRYMSSLPSSIVAVFDKEEVNIL